jgi:hypothetical protein
MSVAASVRREKEAKPHLYCPNSKCLWKVVSREGANPCRKHPSIQRPVAEIQEAAKAYYGSAV